MDYQPPELCIRSIEPAPGQPGLYLVDMPSVHDLTPQGPQLVSQYIVDSLFREPYAVVKCPPNWPNPPQ